MSHSIAVQTFGSTVEAEWAKNLLQANGVHAAVMADDAGGQLFPLTNEVRLMVMEDDADTARQILDTFDSQEQAEAEGMEDMAEQAMGKDQNDPDYAELSEDEGSDDKERK